MSVSLYRSTAKAFHPLYNRVFSQATRKGVNTAMPIPNKMPFLSHYFHAGRNETSSIYSTYGQRIFNQHLTNHYKYCRQRITSFFKNARNEATAVQQQRNMSTRIKKAKKILRPKRIKRASTRMQPLARKEWNTDEKKLSLLEKWIAPRPMPPRKTFNWYLEMALVCTVFAITGTSTMGQFSMSLLSSLSIFSKSF